MLLDAQGLDVVYGRTHAVKNVSVQVKAHLTHGYKNYQIR